MMDSRLKPNTTAPAGWAQVPGSSGPRWRIRCDAWATASAVSWALLDGSAPAAAATKASSPHIALSMPQSGGSQVGRKAAGPQDAAAGGCDDCRRLAGLDRASLRAVVYAA